jgi:simple sugar transport system substrate-binding protein
MLPLSGSTCHIDKLVKRFNIRRQRVSVHHYARRSGMFGRRIISVGLVGAMVAGCSAGAASPSPEEVEQAPLEFIMVTHSPATDVYWVDVTKGLEQAGKDLGVTVTYRGTDENIQDPDQQRKNIEAAIAAQPDGLIISNPTPDSLDPVIQKATAAGIPVVLVNQGSAEIVDRVGALTFVGDDPAIQGRIGAERMNALGCQHALEITTPLGVLSFIDLRTNGFKDAFQGKTSLAEIPLSDINDSNRIKTITETELQKEPTIDCVFSIGSAIVAAMLEVRNDLGDRGKSMHWGTIDLTSDGVAALQNGEMDFALDAQQYTQGYYPVVILALYKRLAIQPASKTFLTGPAVITPENVGDLVAARGE